MKRHAFLFASACLAVAVHSAQEPELLPFWDASDESNPKTIDHGAWQELLDTYLNAHPSGVNRFDYAALNASASDMSKLNVYLDELQSMDPRTYSLAEQKAYWINFYNSLTIKVVADAYPVDSIKEIHEGWLPRSGPWGDVHAEVVGQELTLDDIEHRILRPIWKDARIHYGVNCASIGCPNLATAAYTGANTEALLDAGAREYVNHQRGVEFVDEDFIVISSIYEWFVIDFGDSEEGVLAHLIRFAADDLSTQLKNFEGAIDYEYDWNLNKP